MADAPVPQSRRPKDSDFYQQRMKAWQPILTPKWVIITFLIIGIPFIILGFVLKASSDNVVEYRVQYDGAGTDAAGAGCAIGATGAPKTCTIAITTTQEMKAPVYVYYELQNFYQNHRRYVKSKSDLQLQGDQILDAGLLTDCDPLRTAGNRTLYPCGLIANSYFNDTIALTGAPVGVTMDETGISWQSDRDKKFKAADPAWVNANRDKIKYIDETYPGVADVTNEHFIVWMRVAALPTFRKLYGKIGTTIPAGTTLTFSLNSAFRVANFDGKKSLIVSTTSFIGGKNPFLGIAYLVVGFLCIGLAVLFTLKQFFGGRRLGDTQFLVWQTRR